MRIIDKFVPENFLPWSSVLRALIDVWVGALLLFGLLLSSSYDAEAAPARAAGVSNVALTAAQRQKIHTEIIKPSTFRRTIETTGTVGFDNDQATTVLAPVSGPVSRLVVSLGTKVKAGDVLATVASPDYATAISAYRKAVVTAKNLRRIAFLDKSKIRLVKVRHDPHPGKIRDGETGRGAGLQELAGRDQFFHDRSRDR